MLVHSTLSQLFFIPIYFVYLFLQMSVQKILEKTVQKILEKIVQKILEKTES